MPADRSAAASPGPGQAPTAVHCVTAKTGPMTPYPAAAGSTWASASSSFIETGRLTPGSGIVTP